jgi:hypothetical protein
MLSLTQVYSVVNTANSATWSMEYSISGLFPDAETVPDYTLDTRCKFKILRQHEDNIATSSRNKPRLQNFKTK